MVTQVTLGSQLRVLHGSEHLHGFLPSEPVEVIEPPLDPLIFVKVRSLEREREGILHIEEVTPL